MSCSMTSTNAPVPDLEAPSLMRRFREANQLTMAKAAALLGTTWDTWRRWEKGLNKPHVDMALRLADVTGIPVTAWRSEPSTPKLVKVA